MTALGARVLGGIAWGAAASTVAVLILMAFAASARETALTLAVALSYTVALGPPIVVAFHLLAPRLRAVASPWHQALAVALVPLPISALGDLAVVSLWTGLGVMAPAAYWRQYAHALRISALIGAFVSVAWWAFERTRAQRDAHAAALGEREATLAELTRELARAQASAAAPRLAPHLLANALTSALALVRRDPGRARVVLESLGDLLRAVLRESAEPLHPLRDELALVRQYVVIEQVRFGERLEVRFEDADLDAACAALVPPLAVQALVENAIKHAVAARGRTGGAATVTVAVRRDGESVCIEVRDEGRGDATASAPAAAPRERPAHGLRDLRARLGAALGASARLELRLDGPRGAVASLRVPHVATARAGVVAA